MDTTKSKVVEALLESQVASKEVLEQRTVHNDSDQELEYSAQLHSISKKIKMLQIYMSGEAVSPRC